MTLNQKYIAWDIHEALSLSKDHLIATFSSQHQNFQACQQQADEGDLEAQLYIAACYDVGHGVIPSHKKAFHYYKLAADQGNIQAQVSTAFCYEYGKGVEQSDQQAFYYYQLAAEQGNSIAQALLGRFYTKGRSVEQSYKEALHYYQLAVEQDNLLACEYLAEAYTKGLGVEVSKEKAAFYTERIKQKADVGDALAQIKMGRLFEKGIGLEKSLESSFYYYKLAADQGQLQACVLTAQSLIEGKGVMSSSEKAISYYQIAADAGYVPAQAFLGWYLLKNKLNLELAVHYLKLVAQTGNEAYKELVAVCRRDLAECFEKGRGVNQSNQNALYYYRLAVDNGDVFAQDRLGDAYLKGEMGLKSDAKQAIYYYQLAANQGNEFSLKRLAECYETGQGVEQSFEQAFKYYKLAADIQIQKSGSWAIDQLARCHELGIGTEISLNKAIYYYKLAGDNGLKSGYYHAALCYRKLGGLENAEKALACLKISAAAHYLPAELELKSIDNPESQNIESKYQIALDFLKNREQVHQYLVLASPEQQLAVARLYERMKEIENHKQEAFKYCQLAADQGYAPAQYQFGCYYEEGIGTHKSLEQAFKYYHLAANQGFEEAIKKCHKPTLLLNFFKEENPSNPNKLKTLRAHKMGEQNADDINLSKGRQILENASNLEEEQLGISYLKEAAKQGSEQAWGDLFNYYNRRGNCQAALPYLQVLVDYQLPSAYYHLGLYYEKGLGGLPQSLPEAFKYFKLAAAQRRQVEAQLKVGICYEFGQGVEKSIPEAMYYYKQLAELDYSDAQCRLGLCYEKYQVNFKKAAYYYKLAAEQGCAQGMWLLGNCYIRGKGVSYSPEEAIKYYLLSAKGDYADAYQSLGICFFGGKGVSQSLEQALSFFKQAQAKGVKEAQEGINSCLRCIAIDNCLAMQNLAYKPKFLDIGRYQENKNLEILKKILNDCHNQAFLLYLEHMTKEEIQISCDALLDNPCLFVVCLKIDSQALQQALINKGDNKSFKSLECFISDDVEAVYMHFLDRDEESRDTNENLVKVNTQDSSQIQAVNKLYGIHNTIHQIAHMKIEVLNNPIPSEAIHPQSQNIGPYLKDQNIEMLKKIFEIHRNSAIYLQASQPMELELEVLRDEMIQNSRFTFICSECDAYRLSVAFEKIGYDPKICLKRFKLPNQDYYSLSYMSKAASKAA